MKKALTIALAALALAAPVQAAMTTAERAVCVRQLKNSLKDPHSLRRLGSPSQENARIAFERST